jgi:hypothetical protein
MLQRMSETNGNPVPVELDAGLLNPNATGMSGGMTIWKGMFRLWVLATALWTIFVTILSWGMISNPSIPRHAYFLKEAGSTPYQLADAYPSYSWIQTQREIALPNWVILYAPRDVPDQAVTSAREALRQASDDRTGEAWGERMEAIVFVLAVIAGASGAVLAIGFAVRWVVKGFGFQSKKPTQ